MLMKRLLLYFAALVMLLAVAVSAGQLDKEPSLLTQYAEELGAYVAEQEPIALSWVQNNRGKAVTPGSDPALADQDFTILLYRQDSLIFWSNNKVLPAKEDLAGFKDKTGHFLTRLPLGWFVVHQENPGPDRSLIFVPLRYHLDNRSSAHTGLFPANDNISNSVDITDKQTEYPVQVQGSNLAWLTASGTVYASWIQWMQLVFIGLALLVFLLLLQNTARALAGKYGSLPGFGVFLAGIAALIGINRVTGATQGLFDGIPVFATLLQPASLLGNSLGDCLMAVALLTWTAVFFHRYVSLDGLIPSSQGGRTSLALAFYALSALSVVTVGIWSSHWVTAADFSFDFDNILGNSPVVYAAIAATLIAWVAAYQWSLRLVMTIKKLELSRSQRWMAVGTAAVISLGAALVWATPLNPFLMAGLAALLVGLLDGYVHDDKPGFGWAVIWLLLGAMFTAGVLYPSASWKNQAQRMAYAEVLANPRDTEAAEVRLLSVANALNSDLDRLGFMLKPWPFKAEESDLRRYVNDVLYRENYLFQHYRVQVYAFDRENGPLLIHQNRDYDWIARQNWEKGTPLQNNPNARYCVDAEGNFRYMLLLTPKRMGDPGDPASVWCFFDQEYPKPTRVYARLFYYAPYKNLPNLSRYDFAVQRQGIRMVEQGPINLDVLAGKAVKGAAVEVKTVQSGRSDAVYQSQDGLNLTAVGHASGAWYKPFYLFALIFMVASVALFFLVLLNSRFALLPEEYASALSTKGSLEKRIHYWSIATLGIAFFIIGLLTYRHFSHSAAAAEQADLDFRSDAILANLKSRVNSSILSADSLRQTLPQTVGTLASSLSMDVNLYDPKGNLKYSTQADLTSLGVLSAKINPVALHNLTAGGSTMLREKAAGATYEVKYMPIKNAQQQLLGFLGIPNDLSVSKPGTEVSDFIGMLAALYVCLLLLAFTLTYFLARSIIQPIATISERIKNTNFEQENNPIDESTTQDADELSALIKQYNAMVGKLEDSKVRIIKLEREGAWREMARQVAHDIKNPLTTMKLSMQQLERVSNNPEQAAAYLRKAITRLIEQIDSLAQIASEFSMFANLDIRQKSDVLLNEVVESVFDLFSEQKQVDLDLSLPADQLHILGDKNHLIRVFNNLVINAIQAIPSDRRGHIKVSLKQQGGNALVLISDNGGGIPPEIRHRVFEPNFTTKTSGSGLGLAICRKIIEAHDGTIDFETRDNEGTDFAIVLPVTMTEPGEAKEVKASPALKNSL